MQFLRRCYQIALSAFYSFGADDGWALASHIALSVLLALFPFLIVLTTIAGFVGSASMADDVANLLLQIWPKEVADPIAREIHNVLTIPRSGLFTIGVVLAVYFASSGVDSLRIALNRAYNVGETRAWWLLKLESIAYVIIGVIALLALGFLIVLAPLVYATSLRYAPWLSTAEKFTYTRYVVASIVIVVALVVTHKWLPEGRRRFLDIAPGVIVTLVLWLAGGILFGRYLAEFAHSYVTMYAGLASAMIALVFLYWIATIFVYGGELNQEIIRERQRKIAEEAARRAAQAEAEALANAPRFEKFMRWMGYEKRKR